MPKSLSQDEITRIASILPKRDRSDLAKQSLSKEWLSSQIELCQKRMKRDLWIGLPWFLIYSYLLFTEGVNAVSMGVFAVGMVYFVYTIFTTGSYGLNKNRVKVYKQLLEELDRLNELQ